MLFGLEVLAAFLILQFSLSAPQMLTYLFEWRGGIGIGRADWLSGWGCREFATRYEVQVRQTAPGDNACPPKSDHRAHTCTLYICWFASWLAGWLSTCALISGPRPSPWHPTPKPPFRPARSFTHVVCAFAPDPLAPVDFFHRLLPLRLLRTCS